jgi:hypothetical protein
MAGADAIEQGKKKPKQDKNKKKGSAAPSPFASGQNPSQPGQNRFGKK